MRVKPPSSFLKYTTLWYFRQCAIPILLTRELSKEGGGGSSLYHPEGSIKLFLRGDNGFSLGLHFDLQDVWQKESS